MPKKNDINKILIIGSGPIIIGQACEFDYSGTQACKALRNLGYKIVLVNSNPATIMTDPDVADITYIEPLNVKRLTQIIEKERPDALLPNLGGQSGLNLCSELSSAGVLEKYNVKVIGVQVDAIERGEDRIEFKNTMDSLGIEMARSKVAYSVDEAVSIAEELKYPVVLRPAYTMGGAGGGMVYNVDELKVVCERGLQASIVGQVLVEECISGWEELELEVVRDSKDNVITVCFIENIDPLGVHTGDSFCSAPMLTISEDVQKVLQDYSYKIIKAIEVIGGCNCQFAHDPKTGRIVVIEINPRTSRSSALASKATGFPIALVSAMLACGLTLDEIPCGKYGTLDKYVPDGEYVVIKFARWAFEKFKGSEDKLGTQMRAVGEVMSIGKTYKEAFQKSIRSLENGRYGLGFASNLHDLSKEELLQKLNFPSSERQFIMYEALRKGATVEELYQITKIKHYFIEQMLELVNEEEALMKNKGVVPSEEVLRQAKLDGFADRYLSKILEVSESDIRNARLEYGITESWEGVHVSGTKDAAYYYSTYHLSEDKSPSSDKPKIMILGGGPNRIGQGIEFDYCCVHASLALRKLGFESIIVNCNPETVSTDYDTSDKLYFEPLTLEDVLSIHAKEKPLGVIAQFGGQTPLNLAADLKKNGVKILGTTPETIDLAEDRDHFRAMMDKLEIPMPESGMAVSVDDALSIANRIGYPVMVRP
ncbi:MAG: carbamoyl-phosphate synthase large subunit, partial [Saccharofermentanales bacterium]